MQSREQKHEYWSLHCGMMMEINYRHPPNRAIINVSVYTLVGKNRHFNDKKHFGRINLSGTTK